jgi:RTX calcium-binding nonapeptide repeat (4 copies)
MPTSLQTKRLLSRAAAAVFFLAAAAVPAHATVTASIVGAELRVAGDAAGDAITVRLVTADTTRVEVLQGATPVGNFLRSLFTTITIDAGGGDDTVLIDEINGAFTDTETTVISGGDGNDTITGGIGTEVIVAGPGNDTINPRRGNDVLFGGEGDDRFIWNPGDGSDVVEGQAGTDTLEFHGSNASENYALAPNGTRASLFRDVAAITMDVAGTEILQLTMLGGNDNFITSPGLTTLTTLDVDAGDGLDTVVGGAGNDRIVGGTAADISADNLQGGGGDDQIDGGGGDDTLSGGDGNDTILGGVGVDTLAGGAGDDVLTGGQNNDTITGGSGNDRMTWAPGEGSDIIDGQTGTDALEFNGSNASENISIFPNGARVSFTRDVAAILMDLGTIERIQLTTLGSVDTVTLAAGLDGLLELITLDTGLGNDTINTTATSATLALNGGLAELDTLNVNLLSRIVDVLPATIAINGLQRIAYADIESLNFSNTVSTLPTVTINTPTSSPSTTSAVPFISIGGSAADPGGAVQAVTWSNDRGGSGTATGTTTWSVADVALQAGTNTITVSALDSSGNRRSDTLAVVVSALSYSLAEGATGSFFDLDVSIANPSASPAPVTVTFLREDGSTVSQNLTLAATSRTTVDVDSIVGLENQGGVSTVVTSTSGVALVAERTMFWDASGYGAHGGSAVDGPRTRWLFAEGSEGFFNTFVLLANPGATAATATLTFLREGSTPFVRVVNVPATSRVTVAANASPELVGRAFSIVVDADAPILAERAMYFGTARLFDGGHESAGVPAGATSWFLAEGATGSFFTTFVLVGNPNPAPANVTMTFLTDGGQTVVRNKVVPANGRLTVNIATEDPILASAAVSTTVTADQPVVAERAMYWPGTPATWAEAHNSFGATTLGTKWGLAEGRVGMAQAFQTYILLANPSGSTANVRITFLRADGTTVVKTFAVNPTSRFNVHVNSAAPELVNEAFGALIEVTNAVGISVERAMYSDALGQIWAAGTNALATRLP